MHHHDQREPLSFQIKQGQTVDRSAAVDQIRKVEKKDRDKT